MKRYVSTDELVTLVRSLTSGTTHVTVELDSDMDGKGKMRTTGNPFAGLGIVKRETLNGTIGYIYENAVNRLASKEDKEVRDAKPHPWGDMDEKHLFRINRKTGAPYLSMMVKNVEVHGFFLPDGTEVAKDVLTPFLPVKVKSSTQADLDGEVIVRDYSMKNIKTVRAFGYEFCISDNLTEQERASKTMVAAKEPAAAN